MTLDEAKTELTNLVLGASPDAVLRYKKRGSDELAIRVYAPADHEDAIREATRERSIALLTEHDLDVQILIYDISTSLPTEEGAE
ncbi:hypothetical protein [Herpetosiphon llansteffanensis]|uniref:hypothetical protein n=1 Tax=Herpetosiphon llansteffanensis TaxID=2094568 RepID=UPI000D7CDC0A|nr:hypothetical protein [Herpetosiphon llansteffanensis]